MDIYQANPEGVTAILKTKKILICGAGGLGSNVAMLLTRAGIQNFTLIDFDIVSESNLNRQFFFQSQLEIPKVDALQNNLLAIQPSLNIQKHHIRLTTKNFAQYVHAEYDAILECFDNPIAKAQLTVFVKQHLPTHIPYICVSGLAGVGELSDIKIIYQIGNMTVIGDGTTDASQLGTLSTRVMAAATLQAHTAIQKLL